MLMTFLPRLTRALTHAHTLPVTVKQLPASSFFSVCRTPPSPALCPPRVAPPSSPSPAWAPVWPLCSSSKGARRPRGLILGNEPVLRKQKLQGGALAGGCPSAAPGLSSAWQEPCLCATMEPSAGRSARTCWEARTRMEPT